MRRFSNSALRVLAAAALLAAPLAAQDRNPDGRLVQPFLALTHANILDVHSGRILPDRTVVLQGGKIISIDAGTPPAGTRVLDLRGKYLLPGLMDAHTHLDNLAAARRALESGVTTARSASVDAWQDVALRDLVRQGYVAGPDMLASGLFIRPELENAVLADAALGPLLAGPVRGVDALRAMTRVNLSHGVDFIKTRATERAGLPNTDPRQQTYSEAELKAIVDEATARGVPVMVHAHGDEGAYLAVKVGARSIEHGTYLSDSTLALMRQRGTYFVPTYTTVVDLVEPGGDYDDPILHVRGMHMLPRLAETVRQAHTLGVRIVTGGDTGYGPESVTRISHELLHFTELGLTPLEALQSATVTAAELFRISDRTGAVEPGLEADLIAVEGNPLENIRVMQDVLLVVSNGRVALDRLSFMRR